MTPRPTEPCGSRELSNSPARALEHRPENAAHSAGFARRGHGQFRSPTATVQVALARIARNRLYVARVTLLQDSTHVTQTPGQILFGRFRSRAGGACRTGTVSYTHLTLPTSDLV